MRKISTLFLAFVICTGTVFASKGKVDGIWYDFDNDFETATVTNGGIDKYSGTIIIPSSVMYNGTKYSVTHIGYRAFYGCYDLTSVTIPNSVTNIGDEAFFECIGLSSVIIPNSVTIIADSVFAYCTGIKSVTIPNSVKRIGSDAFLGCSSLKSITIPESVARLYKGGTFQGCTSLTEVYWNAKKCEIEPYDDKGNYYPPFMNLGNIKKFVFGSNVRTIPATLCCGLSGLDSILLPNSLQNIGDKAFGGCTALKSITIPESVNTINMGATFHGCTSLTEVYWNAIDCDIKPDDEGYYYPPFLELSNIKKFIFGSNVEKTPDFLCAGLSGLESILLPSSLKNIGYKTFFVCDNLNAITCEAIIPPVCENIVNDDKYEVISLRVPEKSIDDYKNADEWKKFYNIIAIDAEAIDEVLINHEPAAKGYKILRDGQILILRGEKVYTVTGQEVK